MALPFDPSSSSRIEAPDETTIVGLDVRGSFPTAMSGRLLGAHGGVVHSVHLGAGHDCSFRNRRVATHANNATSDIVVFGGSILAFSRGCLAEELSPNLDTSRPVDLAGRSQHLCACPKHDPITGDLHLLAVADGAHAHVVVSSGALTRRSRTIPDPPNDVADLATTRDHVLFATDGFVGITGRDGESRITWIATGVDAPVLVHAHDVADAVVIHTLTPSLERWTLNISASTVERTVLDPTPRRIARTGHLLLNEAPRFLCTIGDRSAATHDLATGSLVDHSFGLRQPGDLAFVADPSRRHAFNGGWLLGFLHEASTEGTDLVVLDAADLSRPPVAAVRIPRHIPREIRTTWMPETTRNHQQGDQP